MDRASDSGSGGWRFESSWAYSNMRVLESEEVEYLEPMIRGAVGMARLSPCGKSKRGAVVFRGERILGRGFNAPTPPHCCLPERCSLFCRSFAVHAERNACYEALSKGFDLTGASILHIKIKNHQIVPVDEASCLDCSSYLMILKRDGMPLRELILMHEDEGDSRVYKAHTIEEFFQNSLNALNK